MMYQDICNCICQNTKKKWRHTVHYVKPTAQLLFKSRFPNGGPTCRRQVVNPRHQMPQGQSVARHSDANMADTTLVPELLELSITEPLLLPPMPNLLTSPTGDPHPLLADNKLTLAAWKILGKITHQEACQKQLNDSATKPGDLGQNALTQPPGKNGVAGLRENKWILFKPLWKI